MSKHTPGPLTVKVSDKWPFDIVTTDDSGNVKFVTRIPCHSSKDRTNQDAIACKHFRHSEREEYSQFNRQAIADEVLRAAAPELLEALQDLVNDKSTEYIPTKKWDKARAAIAKATGEA